MKTITAPNKSGKMITGVLLNRRAIAKGGFASMFEGDDGNLYTYDPDNDMFIKTKYELIRF